VKPWTGTSIHYHASDRWPSSAIVIGSSVFQSLGMIIGPPSNEWVTVQIVRMIFGVTYTYIEWVDVSGFGLFILLLIFILTLALIIFAVYSICSCGYEVTEIILHRVIHASASLLDGVSIIHVWKIWEHILILVFNNQIVNCCFTFFVRIFKQMLEAAILSWIFLLLRGL
jgi:hypothetical protein